MLEVVAHAITQNNTTLLPICENYNFLEIDTALEKTRTFSAKFQCVVKVEDNLLEKFNNK